MIAPPLDRRDFARAVASALGACLVPSGAAKAAAQRGGVPPHTGLPAGTLRLDSNENPYGPSPAALEAMSRSQPIAARYPDALEEELIGKLAKMHGVGAENLLLG